MRRASDNTTPLQLNGLPVCRPQGLRREGITDDLSQLSLCFRPVSVSHLSKAFRNPFPAVAHQRGSQVSGISGEYFSCGGQEAEDIVTVMGRNEVRKIEKLSAD